MIIAQRERRRRPGRSGDIMYEIINVYGGGDYEKAAETADTMAAMVIHYNELVSSRLDTRHCVLCDSVYSDRLNCRVGKRVYYGDEN